MAMRGDAVRLEAVVKLGQKIRLFRRASRARYAGLRIDDDTRHINEVILGERREREDARRRVAARVANDLRTANRLAIELCQTIDALGILVRMLNFVPRFIDRCVSEAIVRTEIDDARLLAFERLARRHRMTVRQADENEIAVSADALDVLHALKLFIVNAAKMRIDARNLLPRMALRRDMHDIRLRVFVKKPQKLRPRVACSSDNTHSHVLDRPFPNSFVERRL